MFEQVQSERFYIQIVKQIRQNIAEGKLKVGDKLPPERVLAQEFGTSRASIREALSALEMLGLIECKSGQGNFVRVDGEEAIDGEVLKEVLSGHSPYEVFEARLEIEPMMGGLAAERATADQITKLSGLLQRLNALGEEAQHNPDKVEEYMEEDRRFHLEIARSANNSVLFTVSAGVNLMTKEKHWTILKRKCIEKEGSIQRFQWEHTAIFNAIRGHESELARTQLRRHIETIKRDMFET